MPEIGNKLTQYPNATKAHFSKTSSVFFISFYDKYSIITNKNTD